MINNIEKYSLTFNHCKKIIFILLNLLIVTLTLTIYRKKKKIGIIGVRHCHNIGANLVKYAISIKLYELGFIPYIIGTHYNNYDISFLKRNTNLIIIKYSFSEIKRNDFDILMISSDQTWRKFDKFFYDHAFLKFAQNWTIPKIVYGASLGYNYWKLTKNDEKIAKNLLQSFKAISVREKGSINLVRKHLGINPELVLDPTLLIDKKYYLRLIHNIKGNNLKTNDCLFIYSLRNTTNMRLFIDIANKKLGYKIYYIEMNTKYSIEKFIYGIINCKAVITNSFHGTLFSIIFNKPFITFIFKGSPKERFLYLKDIFKIGNRIIEDNTIPNIGLLSKPLNINYSLMNKLKLKSIKYLKKNLGIL